MSNSLNSLVVILFTSVIFGQTTTVCSLAQDSREETPQLDQSVMNAGSQGSSHLITGGVADNVLRDSAEAGNAQRGPSFNRPNAAGQALPGLMDTRRLESDPEPLEIDNQMLKAEVSQTTTVNDGNNPKFGLVGAGTHVTANIVFCDFVTNWKAKPWAQLRSEVRGEEAHDGPALKAAWNKWKQTVNQILSSPENDLGADYGHAALHVVVNHDGSFGLVTDYTGHEDKFGGIPSSPKVTARFRQILAKIGSFPPFPSGSQASQCHVLVEATHYPLHVNDTQWESYNRSGMAAFQQAEQATDPGQQQDLYQEAKTELSSAVAEADRLGPQDPRLSASLNNLAQVYQLTDDYAHALPLMYRLATITERTYGPDSPALSNALHRYAQVLHNTGDVAEGQQVDAQARSIIDRNIQLMLKQNRIPEAQQLAAIGQNIHVPGNLDQSDFHAAQTYHHLGRYAEAEPYYKRELAYREKLFGPEDARVAVAMEGLAENYRAQGLYGEAAPLYDRALAIDYQAPQPNYGRMVKMLKNYASVVRQTQGDAAASQLEQRALEIQYAQQQPEAQRSKLPGIKEYPPQGTYREAGVWSRRL